MKRVSICYYTIQELKDNFPEAYHQAMCKHFDINTYDTWHDYSFYDFGRMLEKLGFKNAEIFYSGFYSQGDGLSFIGDFHAVDMQKDITEEFPDEEKLNIFYKEIKAVSDRYEELSFSIRRNSRRYCHEKTVFINGFEYENDEVLDEEMVTEDQYTMQGICRSLMRYFYRKLKKEYEYLTSDEAVFEALKANDMYFTDKGIREMV